MEKVDAKERMDEIEELIKAKDKLITKNKNNLLTLENYTERYLPL